MKGFLRFSTSMKEEIYVKMGISTVSTKNALENLMTEMPGWDFEKVKKDAEEKWEKELSKIKIETNDLKKKEFFTLLCIIQ